VRQHASSGTNEAQSMPCAQGLLGEQLLHEWLRAWAVDDGLHAFMKCEGSGWLLARALAALAARGPTSNERQEAWSA
jgi:hypothetical protein